MKPAMGFTLPSAGVTPAPGEKKSRNGEDAISLSGSGSENDVSPRQVLNLDELFDNCAGQRLAMAHPAEVGDFDDRLQRLVVDL